MITAPNHALLVLSLVFLTLEDVHTQEGNRWYDLSPVRGDVKRF